MTTKSATRGWVGASMFFLAFVTAAWVEASDSPEPAAAAGSAEASERKGTPPQTTLRAMEGTEPSAATSNKLSDDRGMGESEAPLAANEEAPVAAAEATTASPEAAAPSKPDGIELANGKLKITALFFGDYAYYYHTGFGPQFLTQINPPGPGNNGYNTFEITRTYLNVLVSPNEALTLRITPNIYRQIGAAPATKDGAVSGIGANTDQELAFRLKYAYLDVNRIFPKGSALGKDRLTVGQQFNPMIDWEESLYGFRYVNLVPWNYLSLSSTQTGISLQGPIESGGKQYVEYSVGVFTNASFRQLEQTEKKQFMGRVSVYPMGAATRFHGLGLTGFVDLAQTNVAKDTNASIPVHRFAGLIHYTTRSNNFGIAGEIDWGKNAFTSGNLFSGSGPQDEFGLGTTSNADFDALTKAIQNTNGARQRSYAGFGHLTFPRTRVALFGMYHLVKPNTDVGTNPLDFYRIVAGLQYKCNDRLRFSVVSQSVTFDHSQFTFPNSQLLVLSPSLAASHPNGIPNAVPPNIGAIFVNVEFNF